MVQVKYDRLGSWLIGKGLMWNGWSGDNGHCKNIKSIEILFARSLVEVCYKPRLGLPGVKDREREEVFVHFVLITVQCIFYPFLLVEKSFSLLWISQVITRTCTAAVLTSLHPRTAVTINIQESCWSLLLSSIIRVMMCWPLFFINDHCLNKFLYLCITDA